LGIPREKNILVFVVDYIKCKLIECCKAQFTMTFNFTERNDMIKVLEGLICPLIHGESKTNTFVGS